MQGFEEIANSNFLFIVCAFVILLVVIQSAYFIWMAYHEPCHITNQLKQKTIVSSAIFSIIPSIPIILSLMLLMNLLGRYIPWLRLSVVGSFLYERSAAEMTAKKFFAQENAMNAEVFVSILWVMTLGIISGLVMNVFFLKTYLNSIKKESKIKSILVHALYTGLILFLTVPKGFDTKNKLGTATFYVAGFSALLFDFLSKKWNIKSLKEFGMPFSMIVGMIFAILSKYAGVFS